MRKETKNRSKALGVLVLLAAGGLLLTSCNSGGAGIFYTLAKATAQTTTGIGDTPSVASMGLVTGTPGVYYAAAGTVYTALSSSTPTWKAVTAPVVGDICTSLTVSGNTLYAVYYNPNADTPTSFYLYQAPVSGSAIDTAPSWSAVSPFNTNSTFTVQKVYQVNAQILVMVQENNPPAGGGQYTLYQLGNSTPILSDLPDPPDSGTFDTSTGTYWFVGGYASPGTAGGPALFTGTALASLAQDTTAPSVATGVVYRNVYYSTVLNTLFLSTSAVSNTPGAVYANQGGGGWTTSTIISWPSGTTQTGLCGFDEYEVSSTSDAVLVGADTGGYYEIDLNPTTFSASALATTPAALGQPGNTTTITAGSDYPSTTLASAHVIGFFNETGTGTATAPQRIFGLTQNGLWVNEVVSGTQRTWTLQ